jgi:cell division protein FtsX
MRWHAGFLGDHWVGNDPNTLYDVYYVKLKENDLTKRSTKTIQRNESVDAGPESEGL